MRERPNISDEELRACLRREYEIETNMVEFLPLGLDTKAGVFRVVSKQGTNYLLKVKSGSLYEPSLLVPRFLSDQGIGAVVAPTPTIRKRLWTLVREWTVVLYLFVEGTSGWQTRLTDEQWRNLGASLRWIHQTKLPAGGFERIRKETFDPTGYSSWIREFETQQAEAVGGTENERVLRALWVEHQETIHAGVSLMEELAEVLREQVMPFVICHADLHPGNEIRNDANEVFVVDWDEVMLAPKERDFLFVMGMTVENTGRGGGGTLTLPFFQGYGQTEVDWHALTYYLWERVVQDLIACTQDVIFRDDLEEETKAEAVELFADILSEGGEVNRARAAATNISQSLNYATKRQ